MKKIALKNAARGTAFDYAGQSWILLENDDGRALCLSKDIIETRAFDEGNCNNFAVASSKEYLNGAYLDNLLEDVNGPDAFLTTELDLTTDDGLKDYGTCTVTIFLLTVDQYWAASVATLSAASSLLLSAFGRDPVGELTGTIFTACVGYLITYAGKSLGEKISRNRHGLDADGNPLPDPSGNTLNNEEAKG